MFAKTSRTEKKVVFFSTLDDVGPVPSQGHHATAVKDFKNERRLRPGRSGTCHKNSGHDGWAQRSYKSSNIV